MDYFKKFYCPVFILIKSIFILFSDNLLTHHSSSLNGKHYGGIDYVLYTVISRVL